MIELEFPVLAVAQGRPRATSRGGFVSMYTPAKTVNFKRELIRIAERAYRLDPMTGPLRVDLNFYLPRPKSAKKDVFVPITRPDIDNYVKAVFDAMNEILWKDDSQVVDLRCKKLFAAGDPVITMRVRHVTSLDELKSTD